MMKKSQKHLDVIKNFILHISHCSDNKNEVNFESEMVFTPEELYQIAEAYIKKDHTGEDNPENHIVTYGAESSFQTDDREEAFPEQVSIVADFGEEVGTCTAVTIDSTDVQGIQALLDFIEKPEFP
jgi:hypothetical protein